MFNKQLLCIVQDRTGLIQPSSLETSENHQAEINSEDIDPVTLCAFNNPSLTAPPTKSAADLKAGTRKVFPEISLPLKQSV